MPDWQEPLYNVKRFGKDVAVPKSPESEGVPRLMTVSEIALEHGVSRQSVHAYRTRGSFPKPVEGEGSTRPRFREDEVAAWFAANPPRPGKRTDLAPRDEGAGMWSTEDQSTPTVRLSPEGQERLQRAIEQAAVRAALAEGLSEQQSRSIGGVAVEGVRGLLAEWRQE
ncbi:helix-turn-helix transcriptional regulator [Streptomyces sp. NPDC057257]|uniref:helix-turn-helix transcriptional regulator n=1 Tax=Streptomyces sp. NPDC057257 TaxID=3346071 RepID=UPI00363FDFBA